MTARTLASRTLVLVALAIVAASCAQRERTSQPISAIAGGSVLSDTHEIAIPAMALAADTSVTLRAAPASAYPALENARDEVLVIDPEGTELAVPATVTILAEFIAAPDGASVSLAQLASGDGVTSWAFLESALDGETGDVSAAVSRFAPLAVVVAAPATGAAQIRGAISWADGSPAAGAPVQLFFAGTMLTQAYADDAGRFTFGDLEPGAYTVVVDYECRLSESVELSAGDVRDLALALCG